MALLNDGRLTMNPHPFRLVALVLAAAITVSACAEDDPKPTDPPPGTEATSDTDALDEDQASVPTVDDLDDVDTDNPVEVASAWGCAYWAHPRGETPEQLADRLAPLSTPELAAGLAELRLSDLGQLTIEVAPGQTDPGPGDIWTVRCHTTTTGADAAPTGPPTPVAITVHLTRTPDGWRADQATLPTGGLTIP